VQPEAEREVVEAGLQKLVVRERESEKRVRPVPVVGRVTQLPNATQKQNDDEREEELLRDERRHHEHECGHDGVTEPVRMRAPVDAVDALENACISVQQLFDDPGIVEMGRTIGGRDVQRCPNR
jgi:hypothetical protein